MMFPCDKCKMFGCDELCDYFELESRCAWQSQMLERAERIVSHGARLWSDNVNDYDKWLVDYKKGPQ